MLTYIYRQRPDEDRVKGLTDKYKLPENVPNLVVPRTNAEIWDNLNREQQTVDMATQRVQALQANAMTAIIRIIDAICRDKAGPTEAHLQELMDAVRLISMSFSLMKQVRKEAIRNAMGYPLARYCNWETPVGKDFIFADLSKKLKEKEEVQINLRRRNRYR